MNFFGFNSQTRALVSLLFILLVGSCQSLPKQLDPEALSNIRRVAVISAAGQTLWQPNVPWQGNLYSDVSDWMLNDHWEQLLAKAATEAGFEVASISAPNGIRSSIAESAGYWQMSMYNTPNWSNIEGILKSTASEARADVLIVIARTLNDYYGLLRYGLGVTTEREFFNVSASLSLHVDIFLIDGRSGRQIARVRVRDLNRVAWVSRSVSKDVATTPMQEWTPEQRKEVRELALTMADAPLLAATKQLLTSK